MRSPVDVKKMFCGSVAVLLLTVMAFGAEFWDKKEYTQWSEKECKKLLENSPWARDHTDQSARGADSPDAMDSRAPFISYLVQFRSAKPIQQAIVRRMQIANKYDTLSAEQKQQFDKSAAAFFASIPTDGIVVHVSYSTNNQQYYRDLVRHWQAQTAELLKNSVYLSGTKGEKVPLALFAAAGGDQPEFQFIFPRTIDGKPILSPEDKHLRLEFDYPVIGGLGNGRAFMEFKLDKMKFKDELTY